MTLGPDTSELQLRMGIHTGQVTAGVLRGDRARFSLFGDTVNVTARMESTSEAGRVQLSKEAADLLLAAGKENWIVPRDHIIVAKGKGILDTFWLVAVDDDMECTERRDDLVPVSVRKFPGVGQDKSLSKLIGWNVEILVGLIRKIIALHVKLRQQRNAVAVRSSFDLPEGSSYLDEVKEIIHLPQYNGIEISEEETNAIEVPAVVVAEVRVLVETIASMYTDNPFHNFEVSNSRSSSPTIPSMTNLSHAFPAARFPRDHVCR